MAAFVERGAQLFCTQEGQQFPAMGDAHGQGQTTGQTHVNNFGPAPPQGTGHAHVRSFAPCLDPDHRDGHVQRIKRHKPDGVYGVDPADAVRSGELPHKTRPIDDGPNITTTQFRQIPDRELDAQDIAEPTWLTNLAKQHLNTFRVAFGNNDRRMGPNRELRVASACT